MLDIDATTQKQKIQFELIEKITSECFMPLCYGGGVRVLDDFRKLFYMGVEKVSISSLLFLNPDVVKKAISIYGSQSIVVTLDIKKSWLGKYNVYTNSGTLKTKFSLQQAIEYVTSLAVGEIIINSIDREGTWLGFDLDLIRTVVEQVAVPVVALGGAGNLEHIKQVVKNAHASAVGLGSMAVFQAQDMGVLIKFPQLDELDVLFD